jgi:hypothetical protein
MNPFLERFERINKETLSPDAGFEVVQQGDYIFFQLAKAVKPEKPGILHWQLPVERFFIIFCAVMLSCGIYSLSSCECLSWFPRPLSWLLIAGIWWGAYNLIKSYEHQLQEYNRVPHRLFAVDMERQRLVLDMPSTESKSPHTKVDLDNINGFYTRHEASGDDSYDYIYAVTQNQEELAVSRSYWGNTRDVEEMTMILGAICNKPVWRRFKGNEIFPLEADNLFR